MEMGMDVPWEGPGIDDLRAADVTDEIEMLAIIGAHEPIWCRDAIIVVVSRSLRCRMY